MSQHYVYQPHERPLMAGSPASPDHPTGRRVAYLLIGVLLGITGGFQNGLLMANLPQIQGALGLSTEQGNWILAAYSMTTACMSVLMFKVRQQFGIGRFLSYGMGALVLTNFVQLFNSSYELELFARALAGVVGNVMTLLCMFYMMQGLPPKARVAGLVLGIGLTQVALPLARAISPVLMADGDVQRLFMLQFSLSLLCWGSTAWLHLPEGDLEDVFEWIDLLSFTLFAGSVALLCGFLVQGRSVNWDADWLGYALAGAIVMMGAAIWIEHERANPMLELRWMSSRVMINFALTGALVRVLLSEQTVGAAGLLNLLGMGNDQLTTYYSLLAAAALFGVILSIVLLDPTDLRRPVLTALGLIALCAFIDSNANNLTRPANFYATQAVIAFAATYFMGPLMLEGLLRALVRGPSYIISFSALFGLSQTVGGLFGAGFLSWVQTWRAKEHLMELGSRITLTDPLIAQRAQQLGGTLAATVQDAGQRAIRGSASLAQQVAREANVLAFNDVFLLLGVAATLLLLIQGAEWLYDKRRGHVPLAQELVVIAAMISPQKPQNPP